MAARAIWTGVVTFGMVSIPVKLYSATESKDVSFNMLHKECKGRIREQKFCPTCDRKIETDEIEKGYEYAKDQYVIVSKDDLEKLPLPNKNVIEITSFVHQSDIDPVHYDKSYYIEPNEAALKPFTLFMKAMSEKGMTAVANVAIRTKQRLCALRPMDGTLMMSTLLYPDEIRVQRGKDLPAINISDKELAMAESLIDLMTAEFDPDSYKDQYREALLQIIEAKLEGKELAAVPTAAPAKVVDLMEALAASMEAMKAQKAGAKAAAAQGAEEKEAEAKPRSRKKAAAG